jgi:hypothetical protein
MDIFSNLHPVDWFIMNRTSVVPLQDYSWNFFHPPSHYEGFKQEQTAWPREGKVIDYACSVPRDGRLHAQFFRGEGWLFHWDQYDPAQGQAPEHLWHEVKPVRPLVTFGILAFGAYLLSRSE